MDTKIYMLLGLMRRANWLLIGEESCRKCAKSGKIKFVLIAKDASLGTRDKIVSMCKYNNIEYRIFGEKDIIGKYIGKGDVAIVGTNNDGFFKKLISMIDSV